MPIPKVVSAQRDFSSGQVTADAKRNDDHPELKAAVRTLTNFRILNSRGVTNRPGRKSIFQQTGRVDKVQVTPGVYFYLCFNLSTITIRDVNGASVATSNVYPWTDATVGEIDWCLINRDAVTRDVVITFPNMIPLIARYSVAAGTWSLVNFTFNNNLRAPFYRMAPKGITIQPSATTGSVTVTASSAVFENAMIGTMIRFIGQIMSITAVASSTSCTCTVNQVLPETQELTLTGLIGGFAVGDIVQNANALKSEVTFYDGTHLKVNILTPGFIYSASDVIFGPNGETNLTAVATIPPEPTLQWDEQAFGAYRGWPQGCFADQNRLGFCNMPGVPGGIAWSSISTFDDFFPTGVAAGAIFEIAPDNSRVLYVLPGPESSEFVFCETGIYYIPISATNPLKPGSVAFQNISRDGCAAVQPRVVQEIIVYINAGQTRVMSVVAPGAYYRPYETRDLSELHTELFKSPVAIAIPAADQSFPERYAYVLNSDGSVVVGKYSIQSGQIAGTTGWALWNGNGTVKWISALNSEVTFTTAYAPGGAASATVAEVLDATQYLDGAYLYNSVPAGMTPPGGKGPLYWIRSGTCDVIDLGTRVMGTYSIDANGFLVPQFAAGEDLTSVNLMVGQAWTATLEPFVPGVQPGQDAGQRMRKRRIAKIAAYVRNSSGFLMAKRLYSGSLGPNLPAAGTVMASERVTAWNQDDNPLAAPPLRERTYLFYTLGSEFDPRCALIKDTPGPITVLEIGLEVGI